MTPESDRLHTAAEDERTRDHREKRIRDKATAEATAEAMALAERRMQCLRVVTDPTETDFPGCTT